MRPRFDTRVLFVVGIAVACHSLPLTDPHVDAAPDESASGAPGSASSPTTGGGGASGATSSTGGSGGRVDNGDNGGSASTLPGETDGGAAGEHGAVPSAGDGNVPAPGPFDGPARCTSGQVRDPNESEAPEMNPGFPCIFCHTVSNAASGEGDAPIFAFAGTLYPSGHEPNSCIGAGSDTAEVVLRDAADQELRAVANTSGNFLLEGATLTPPFSVKVLFEGRERAATTPHTSPDCNLCHTEAGDRGAPGRVVLP